MFFRICCIVFPKNLMYPLSGCMMPMMALSSVLLPTPLGPIMAMSCCDGM